MNNYNQHLVSKSINRNASISPHINPLIFTSFASVDKHGCFAITNGKFIIVFLYSAGKSLFLFIKFLIIYLFFIIRYKFFFLV